MQLCNIISVPDDRLMDVEVSGSIITRTVTGETYIKNSIDSIHFENAIAFPGLINSHDHLDFNCFPALGNRTYNNYAEWGKYIHSNYRNEINAVLQIPVSLRASWGMYKNLIAGITTVVNHGDELQVKDPQIRIIQDVQNLHSVKNEAGWKRKLNNPLAKKKYCVIHVGEGKDAESHKEITEILKWNFFKRKLIGIHGVAMTASQARHFKAIVWCPESNRFLLGIDAPVKELKQQALIVLGTDSTLTGNWNMWNHIRLARQTRQAKDTEIFEMLTGSPSSLWNLNKGKIAAGKDADIIVAERKCGNAMDSFFATNPEDILLVMQEGNIRLFDTSISQQLDVPGFEISRYRPVYINNREKWVPKEMINLITSIHAINDAVDFPCSLLKYDQPVAIL